MTGKNGRLKLLCSIAAAFTLCCFSPGLRGQSQHRVIEILADHDSRYKIAGQKNPEIIARPGEELTLRITARKAQTHNRDGSIHGFSLLRAKDRKPIDGWDLLLKPGTQEFTLTAPVEPGEYVIVCTVICSPDHEQMNMRFVVQL
ncbi:MAG TPA: hypothetical protein VLW46_00700 [Candidatus Bathyarchaeia archaeon]|nr:hypothetical protein [Candidatus Bathyarchaeia archaeon]